MSICETMWGPRSPFSVDEGVVEGSVDFLEVASSGQVRVSGVILWTSEGTEARDRMVAAFHRFEVEGELLKCPVRWRSRGRGVS